VGSASAEQPEQYHAHTQGDVAGSLRSISRQGGAANLRKAYRAQPKRNVAFDAILHSLIGQLWTARIMSRSSRDQVENPG
jgi:hypothetical protein